MPAFVFLKGVIYVIISKKVVMIHLIPFVDCLPKDSQTEIGISRHLSGKYDIVNEATIE
jgi:hypothetical protein